MNTNKTLLAFLLALTDLDTPLSQPENKSIKEIGDQLDAQPLAWEKYTKPKLLEMIAANPELNQRYQTYYNQLDTTVDIPPDYLPTEAEIQPVNTPSRTSIMRGHKPKSSPTGYDQQINNIVIVVSRSEQPQEVVQKLPLEKLKGFLGASKK
ncbi:MULTISPECIES: hypothetical protein [Moorena]|uniref:Uncharacterized protein n=1 Tax=Moorena producens 3L TaxID=489825 RepID=F4XMT9_9CYAN|nr:MULTISPECIES: hypothetical protein [Moorena]NEP54526.1 hypothetical protein [Moorena sp. SIO3C2]NEQ15231.1 hypothetical protein [Moorena sp. SIO3E2]EGJ33998.1 hypothetical protein LYNGBM3L_22790 [Moorena producens 3L]NEP30020.1 hypothetical protein [Moorena sp. SIO3B2]NEP65481.1 hypothetical protein [Moorena sp. SIO3A5]